MTPQRREGAGALLLVAGLGLAVLAGFWFFGSRLPDPRDTPLSLDGLAIWLDEGGADVRVFEGGTYLEPDRIGLAIVPLYDTDLTADRKPPETEEDLLAQTDQTDLDQWVLNEKRTDLPTLIVLPKWRSGMMLTGIAHPLLVDPPGPTGVLLRRLTGVETAATFAAGGPFADIDAGEGQAARLYLPQLMSGTGCTPLIGTAEAMLLGRCTRPGPSPSCVPADPDGAFPEEGEDATAAEGTPDGSGASASDREDLPAPDGEVAPAAEADDAPADCSDSPRPFWLLSDPDLINAHGLRLGDNAVIARRVLADIAGEGQILIDYSTGDWVASERSYERRERTWADLARYLGPPFTALWVGFALIAVLVLWRASVRYGPVIRIFEDGMRAAKEVSIAARARLLRLSGHDGALLRAHAAARCQAVAAELLGPHRGKGEAGAQLAQLAARRTPALGARLAAALSGIETMAERASVPEAVRGLDALEQILEEIRHDTGRAPRPR